jgi:hypothetical protein
MVQGLVVITLDLDSVTGTVRKHEPNHHTLELRARMRECDKSNTISNTSWQHSNGKQKWHQQ